jgi:hypothetical protein
VGWDWVHLVRRPLFGLLYQPRMIDDDECGAVGGKRLGRGNRSTRRKPAPVPLCPPQIPHDLGSYLGRRGGKPATNRLSYGTAFWIIIQGTKHPEDICLFKDAVWTKQLRMWGWLRITTWEILRYSFSIWLGRIAELWTAWIRTTNLPVKNENPEISECENRSFLTLNPRLGKRSRHPE